MSVPLEDVRKMFTDRGVSCPPIIINEYLYEDDQNPGGAAWHLAQLQRAEVDGVCHASWQNPTYRLCHTIIKAGTNLSKKGEYYMNEQYAAMEGNRVNTLPSTNIELIGVKNQTANKGYILLGNKGGTTNDPQQFTGNVKVVLNNINSISTSEIQKAHVTVKKIPYNNNEAVMVLDTVIDKDYSGKIEFNINWDNAKDAYFIIVDGQTSLTAFVKKINFIDSGNNYISDLSTTSWTARIETENILTDFDIIMGIYNENNQLIDIKKQTAVPSERNYNLTFEKNTSNPPGYVKIFTWNSIFGIKPFTDTLNYFQTEN